MSGKCPMSDEEKAAAVMWVDWADFIEQVNDYLGEETGPGIERLISSSYVKGLERAAVPSREEIEAVIKGVAERCFLAGLFGSNNGNIVGLNRKAAMHRLFPTPVEQEQKERGIGELEKEDGE